MCLQSPSGCEYLLITPDRSLVFPSVEYVRKLVSKAGMKQGSSSVPVVIDSRHIQGADFTAAKVSSRESWNSGKTKLTSIDLIEAWGSHSSEDLSQALLVSNPEDLNLKDPTIPLSLLTEVQTTSYGIVLI
jgi:hypothetical protein